MKDCILKVKENIPLTENVYKMVLKGDLSDIKNPGEFVNIKIKSKFLRRPISVCNIDGDELWLIYKVVGSGTKIMSEAVYGDSFTVLTGLGNGYNTSLSGGKPLLLGGGVGVPPMFYLARKLIAEGKKVGVVLGFNTKSEVFFEKEFRDLGCTVTVTTADGSYGVKGFVTDALPTDYTYFFTCGPEPMLKAVYAKSETSGQFSFEERMGCGFGACMGCSCKTITGYKRICKDGPVLFKEEILWKD